MSYGAVVNDADAYEDVRACSWPGPRGKAELETRRFLREHKYGVERRAEAEVGGSMHLARAGDGALKGRELTNFPILLKTDVSAYTVVGASMAEVEAVERALSGRRRARSSHGVGRPMR